MTVTVQEAIYRAKVEGQQAVDGLARSVDGLSVAEEKLTRATRASEQGFERLQAKLDPLARAQQAYQRTVEQVQRYEAAGIGTMQQRAQLLDIAQKRYQQQTVALNGAAAANDNFAKKTGLSAFQVQNLGFQLNDIASGLAMGQSPFTILTQQGGQVYQVLQSSEKGVIGALKGMGSAIVGLLGPVGTIAVGLTAAGAAALYFWKSSQEPAKTTEELLEEQTRLIGLIKKGYEESATAADKFAASVSNIVRLQEEQNRIELQRRLTEGTQGVVGRLTSVSPSTMAGFIDEPLSGSSQVVERYRAFTKQIEELQAGLALGAPDVKRFREDVAALAVTAPGLRSLADELLNMTDALDKLDPSKLQQTREELERIAQVNAAKSFQSAYKSLLDAAPDANKQELRQQKLLDLARLRGEALDKINQSEALFTNRAKHTAEVEIAYRKAVNAALQENQNAYDRFLKRTDDRIDQLELEAQTAGKTSIEVAKLRLQHEAERAAREAGIPVNQKDLDIRKERLAVAMRENQIANLRRNIQFDRDTMFFSEREREIAREMKNIYGSEWQQNMDSALAKQMRMNDIMRETKDAAVDFATTFVNGLLQGKSAADSLNAALGNLGRQMLNQGINNAISGVFSGNPAMAAGGLVQAGIGYLISKFTGDREAERREAAEQQERFDANKKATKKRAIDIINENEMQLRLLGLDTSKQSGALKAFDIRAEAELKGVRESVKGNKGEAEIAIALTEKRLAKERLQIIKEFAKQAAEAEKERSRSYRDRLFEAGLDMTKLEDQLRLFDRNAQREIVAEKKAGGGALVELEKALAAERMNLIKAFNKQALEETKRAEEQRIAALTAASKNVLTYVQNLQTGAQSPLSPADRFAAAQAAYTSTKNLAAGGNAEAYARFTEVAESLRQAAQAMFGSAAGYQNVFNQIVADALNLTPGSAAEDPVVKELQKVVTAIGVANGNIVLGKNDTVKALTGSGSVKSAVEIAQEKIKAAEDAVKATKGAIDLTKSEVTKNVTSTNNVKTAADATKTAVKDQKPVLEAIKYLGDIQRFIGNALGDLSAEIGTATIKWLDEIKIANRALYSIVHPKGAAAPNSKGESPKWGWTGLESGGIVGNGIYGRDSVAARYAGGGNVMLAGGEGVLTSAATAAIGGRAAIDFINSRRSLPSNDNSGALVAELKALRSQVAALQAELRTGNSIAKAHLENDAEWREDDNRKRPMAARAGR
jgi:hypothetical protein